MTYLTASTSVPLGGSVWVEFMTPCALMSSVHGCRYGLKLKKKGQLGFGGRWSWISHIPPNTHGRGELRSDRTFKVALAQDAQLC